MGSRPSHFQLCSNGPLRLYSTQELLRLPPPTWLIDRLVPTGGLVGIYGAPGVCKSFVAIDMAMSVASGLPWQGHDVDPGFVIYISAEGGTGIGKRILAWLKAHRLKPSQADIAWLIESIPIYTDSEEMATLINRIVDEVQRHPRFVLIDTLARCFDGDENLQLDMGRFIAGVDTLRHEFGSTVGVIHHTRLGGERERGSTAFRGAADAMISVAQDDKGLIYLTNDKQKDSEEHPDITLELVKVEETDSCIVQATGRETERLKKQHDLLSVLRRHGPLSWDEWLQRSGLPRTTFHRVFEEIRGTREISKENGLWRVSGPMIEEESGTN